MRILNVASDGVKVQSPASANIKTECKSVEHVEMVFNTIKEIVDLKKSVA